MEHLNRRVMGIHLLFIISALFLMTCKGKNNYQSKIDILLKDTALVSLDSNQFYFPSEALREASIYLRLDTFVDSWYSKHLFAMREPIIFSDTSHKEIFRFTWLRTFHNPIAIRIEKLENAYILFWKMSSGAGGYEPGELVINKHKEIDESTWNEFQKRLNQADFWRMKTKVNSSGVDGAQWILEGKNLKHYHVVDRWSANKKSKYYECCDFLIGLTDLKINDKDKY